MQGDRTTETYILPPSPPLTTAVTLGKDGVSLSFPMDVMGKSPPAYEWLSGLKEMMHMWHLGTVCDT